MSVLNYILRGLGAPQGHHNVHPGFVTIGHTVQKIECYGQTHYGIRTMWRFRSSDFRSFPFQKSNHYGAYITVLFVCVYWLHLLNELTECHDI